MAMRVEELSRRTGVAGNTIRYYTRIGLLQPRRHESNGYRLFVEADVRRLHFVVEAKALGLSLAQIREIMRNAEEGESPCELARTYVARKVVEVRSNIDALSKLQAKMELALRSWEHLPDGPPDDCPICPLIEAVVPAP